MAAFTERVVNIFLLFMCVVGANSLESDLPYYHGILVAKNENNTEQQLCIAFYPNVTTFPSTNNATYDPIIDLTSLDMCDATNTSSIDVSDKYAIINNGNCTLPEQAQTLQDLGAVGILIVTASAISIPANETYDFKIPFALISKEAKDILVAFGEEVEISIYSPDVEESIFDFSFLVIWAVAVGTIGIGAYWSGLVRHELQIENQEIAEENELAGEEIKTPYEEASLAITPTFVAIFVLCMCGMLVLLYFFYKYLVYVIISIFVVASTVAVFQCLEPLVLRIPIGTTLIPIWDNRCCLLKLQIRSIVLLMGAISLAACWVVYRKESFSWILQDILGICFSINMIRQVRLPSFKIITLILALLFIYDIFFVFITPLFTKNGESVMVEVATGGGSSTNGTGGSDSVNEQLPMVLRVPRVGHYALSVCQQPYSLLGFGDILVPGMLVGFCHGFDLATSSRHKVYYVTTLVAYGVGLVVTFISLYLMASAQPALLYLVPFTVIPVCVLGFARSEMKALWQGDGQVKSTLN